jgi:hypothetical protein
MENFFKKSIKKLTTGAAFVGALAGSPEKADGQVIGVEKDKTKEKIEVPAYHTTNPNDPRIKAYKDSLNLYNSGISSYIKNKSGITHQEFDSINKEQSEYIERLTKLNNRKPSYLRGNFVQAKDNENKSYQAFVFKKPTQKVILDKVQKKDKKVYKQDKTSKIEAVKKIIEEKIPEKPKEELKVEIKIPKGPLKYNTIDKAGNKYYFMIDSVSSSSVHPVTEQEYKNKKIPEVSYEDLKKIQEGK